MEKEISPGEGRYHVELLIVGSNANNGANCGASYANSNNEFGNSNTNIGARLTFYFEKINAMFASLQRLRVGQGKATEHACEPVSMEGI